MVERLSKLEDQIDPIKLPFFAGKAVKVYQQKLADAKTVYDVLNLKVPYAQALLNDGQTEEAIKQIDEYERMLVDNHLTPPDKDVSALLLLKALCYLRLGEQQNCLTNHNADSCL
ncbi:MAG TPA: hypothetical protein VIM69_02765, partial [Opitutaceae bacterium]